MTQNGVTDGDRTRDNQCHKLALYQLNYGHHYKFFGAGNEVRTRDIQLGRLTLYQLSYSRMVGVTGFEPVTPCSQGKCATELRYTPLSLLDNKYIIIFYSLCQYINKFFLFLK